MYVGCSFYGQLKGCTLYTQSLTQFTIARHTQSQSKRGNQETFVPRLATITPKTNCILFESMCFSSVAIF